VGSTGCGINKSFCQNYFFGAILRAAFLREIETNMLRKVILENNYSGKLVVTEIWEEDDVNIPKLSTEFQMATTSIKVYSK